MSQNPFVVSLLLFFLILTLYLFSKNEKTKRIYQFLPLPFWCYFVPTVLASLKIIPYDLPLYSAIGRLFLPTCLFFLLIGTDLKTLFSVKSQSLLAMVYGSIGILVGGLFTYGLALKFLPTLWQEELWKGWGALSATWTGGSANMLAIKEITNISPSLFSNLIVTDTFVAYLWMAFLVYLSKYQNKLDAWLKAKPMEIPAEETSKSSSALIHKSYTQSLFETFFLLAVAFLCGSFFLYVSHWMPSLGSLITGFTWTVILATLIPLFLSQTPVKRLEQFGASSIGQFLLYLMLASIGARANLAHLGDAPLFILLGIIWALVHGLILLLLGRVSRIPLSLLATSSQANIGGTISAPIVASLYSKNLTSIGVLLATLGNIFGTYLGLLFSEVCRSILDLLK